MNDTRLFITLEVSELTLAHLWANNDWPSQPAPAATVLAAAAIEDRAAEHVQFLRQHVQDCAGNYQKAEESMLKKFRAANPSLYIKEAPSDE